MPCKESIQSSISPPTWAGWGPLMKKTTSFSTKRTMGMTTKLLQACLADQTIKCFYTLSACVYPEELQSDKMLMFPSAKATCGSSPLWKHRVCIVLKNSTLNFLYSDSLHELMFVLPGSMMSLALVGHKTTAARRRLPRCCEKPGDEVTVTRRQEYQVRNLGPCN